MVIVERDHFFIKDSLVFFPTEEEVRSLARHINPAGIVAIRQTAARLHDVPHIVRRAAFRTSCIDLTRSLEEIEAAMDRKSCRYEIRRARKVSERIQVTCNAGPAQAGDFLRLYNGFVRTKGHAAQLRRGRLAEYLRVSDLWMLYLDGRPLCGHLLVRDEAARRVRLVFSTTARLGSAEDARDCGMLNRYLHWQELQRYKAGGIETYDLGGIGDGTNSIARFKLSFGGKTVEEYNYVVASALGVIGYRLHERLERFRRKLANPVSATNSILSTPGT